MKGKNANNVFFYMFGYTRKYIEEENKIDSSFHFVFGESSLINKEIGYSRLYVFLDLCIIEFIPIPKLATFCVTISIIRNQNYDEYKRNRYNPPIWIQSKGYVYAFLIYIWLIYKYTWTHLRTSALI